MMLLYMWLMLLLVVSWITATHFSGASPSSVYVNYSAARIVSNTSRYTSKTPVLKKLHWHFVKQCTVFKSENTRCFLGILLHIFLSTAVLTVAGTVEVMVISLSFQRSTLLFINLSNSLGIVLLLMLPLFGMFFQIKLVLLRP